MKRVGWNKQRSENEYSFGRCPNRYRQLADDHRSGDRCHCDQRLYFGPASCFNIASQMKSKTRETIEVDDSEVLTDTFGTDETIVVERDGITATFKRDSKRALQICMEGEKCSKSNLCDRRRP
jgi:hypothetical protein